MTENLHSGSDDDAPSPTGNWPQHARSGVWLKDENGKEILACFCAGGTFNFGFNAPDIRSQIVSLLQTHDAGIWQLPSERRNEGERQFATILPPPLSRTYFVACAGEAFEAACKFAKRITGRKGLVSATNGYYGHIGFSLAMDDPAMLPETYGPLAGEVRRATYGDIEAVRALVDDTTAAVCLETIQVPGGVMLPPDDYFAQVRQLCDERGALLILDEVQGGFCRTGKIWAIDHYGVVPDIMITGKGITGGVYPCGAMSYHQKHREHFHAPVPVHISSYAGNELGASMAGALAQRYADPALCAHVTSAGGRMGRGLKDIAARYSGLFQPHVRGRGLLWAIDLREKALRDLLVSRCMEFGLYVRGSGLHPCGINFQPPLIISEAEVDEALNRFESAAAHAQGG